MAKSGIYTFTNTANGCVYVGSAINLTSRKSNHLYALRGNSHYNPHLQRAWRRYGEEAFVYAVLLMCAKTDLLYFEQRTIDTFRRSRGKASLYNICPAAGSRLGTVASEYARLMTSVRHTGKTVSPEARAKISAARKGKPLSIEHRAKLSAAHTGVKLPPFTAEHKARIGVANSKPRSAPGRANILRAQRRRRWRENAERVNRHLSSGQTLVLFEK